MSPVKFQQGSILADGPHYKSAVTHHAALSHQACRPSRSRRCFSCRMRRSSNAVRSGGLPTGKRRVGKGARVAPSALLDLQAPAHTTSYWTAVKIRVGLLILSPAQAKEQLSLTHLLCQLKSFATYRGRGQCSGHARHGSRHPGL